MSNRSQTTFEVAQMGAVWVASFTLMGISVIGNTKAAAIKGAFDAYETHFVDLADRNTDHCEACN
jgi:hypothetical protein